MLVVPRFHQPVASVLADDPSKSLARCYLVDDSLHICGSHDLKTLVQIFGGHSQEEPNLVADSTVSPKSSESTLVVSDEKILTIVTSFVDDQKKP